MAAGTLVFEPNTRRQCLVTRKLQLGFGPLFEEGQGPGPRIEPTLRLPTSPAHP